MFAPDYSRNDQGHIIFPTDTALRQKLFTEKVEHPSKNNLYIYDALFHYLMKPGETLLDPMAGSGSAMWIARHGVTVLLIELGDKFLELLRTNKPGFEGNIVLVQGDCRKVMPFPATIDHIVFSPPYANQLKMNKGLVFDAVDAKGEHRSILEGMQEFVADVPGNLGLMTDFYFNQAMQDVYRKCYASLKPGGTMTFILKDHYAAKKRVRMTEHHVRMAHRAGFEVFEWHKRVAIGSLFGHWSRLKGVGSVDDEDIVTMKKPEVPV